jgi:hypothetical protein
MAFKVTGQDRQEWAEMRRAWPILAVFFILSASRFIVEHFLAEVGALSPHLLPQRLGLLFVLGDLGFCQQSVGAVFVCWELYRFAVGLCLRHLSIGDTMQFSFTFVVRQIMHHICNSLQRRRHFCFDANPYAIGRRGLRRNRNVWATAYSDLSHYELESTQPNTY